MADFVLLGKNLPSVASLGKMTQGIGFPLRDVDLDTPTPSTVSASDVIFDDPAHPLFTNVAQALIFLLLNTRETSATFTSQNVTSGQPYLSIGGVSSEDVGWINTGTSYISKVTVGRVDVDTATLELLVNGAPVYEFTTSAAINAFYPLFIQLADNDVVSVRKKTGSPSMTSVILTATVKQVSE